MRVGTLVGLLCLAFCILGGWFWTVLVAASIWFIFHELYDLLGAVGSRPSKVIVYTFAILMLAAAGLGNHALLPALLTFAVIGSFFRLIFRIPRATISDIGGTLIAVIYAVYFPVHFIPLRQMDVVPGMPLLQQPGFQYLLLTLMVISFSDIAAYYVGKKFGKNLLSPEISPKKTREGAIGGGLFAVLSAVIFSLWVGFPVKHAVVLSILLVIVGQMGDLAESLMKRDSGVKDSSALLAGHGGFLDRSDSYIFSGAVSYYYILWIIKHQGLPVEIIEWLKQVF